MNRLTIVAAAVLAVGSVAVADGHHALAAEQLIQGVPSEREVIDALNPGAGAGQPMFRGIRPAQTPEEQATGSRPSVSMMVLFEFNSDTLKPEARRQLDQLGKALRSPELEGYTFMLEGHTDAVGDEAYNLGLSERRADSVRNYLISQHGISANRLVVKGVGERDLYDPRAPRAAENRRVKIINLGS